MSRGEQEDQSRNPKGKSTKRRRTEESTGVMTFIQGMLQLKSIRKKSAEALTE